jgi:hypothetical protein
MCAPPQRTGGGTLRFSGYIYMTEGIYEYTVFHRFPHLPKEKQFLLRCVCEEAVLGGGGWYMATSHPGSSHSYNMRGTRLGLDAKAKELTTPTRTLCQSEKGATPTSGLSHKTSTLPSRIRKVREVISHKPTQETESGGKHLSIGKNCRHHTA